MKPTAYLVNAARGSVVHEDALVRALRNGWIAGAGLDVAMMAVADALAVLEGRRPAHPVNPEVLGR